MLFSLPVPFCHTMDLSSPSTIMKGPDTSPHTVNYSHDSAPVSLTETTSKTRTKKLNVDLTDSGKSNKAGALFNAL